MNKTTLHLSSAAASTLLVLLAAAPAAWAQGAAQPAAQQAPAAASAPRAADYIVAVVNTESITNHEVRVRVAQVQRDMARAGQTPPPEEQLRRQVLERLITERAQLQQARELGIVPDDSALAQAELSIARQNNLSSAAELHQRLQEEGIDLAEFRSDLRNQVMLSQLRAREIEPGLKVSDSEVEAFIRQQTGNAQAPQEINLAMILVAVPEGSSAAEQARLKQRAEEVAQRARSGEDFAKLAPQYSDANGGGKDGGVLGLRPASAYPELFVDATRSARVGDIVGPIQSGAGFHVLKVLDRRISRELPDVTIPQTHVRHILLRAESEQDKQIALQRAADLKRRLDSGQATFEELARQNSDDESAQNGGDLGWAPPGAFVPEFEQAMNNLDPGQVSEPVVTRFGVHLISVEGREDQVLNASQQRELARNMLREKKAEEAMETWAQEARARAYVEYRDPPS